MELKGTVYSISETQIVTEKFKKREFIITYADNKEYPEYRKLEVTQDKCALLDNIKVGQEITCQVNMKGRLWRNPQGIEACFNTDQVWKIEQSNFQPDSGENELHTSEYPNDMGLPF
jgi:hypothetical protein